MATHDTKSAKAAIPMGPTGERVADNTKKLRERMGLSYMDLSARLVTIGRPLGPDALYKIEAKKRRVDADELVALSIILRATPNALLLPLDLDEGGAHNTALTPEPPLRTTSGSEDDSGHRYGIAAYAIELWRWACGEMLPPWMSPEELTGWSLAQITQALSTARPHDTPEQAWERLNDIFSKQPRKPPFWRHQNADQSEQDRGR